MSITQKAKNALQKAAHLVEHVVEDARIKRLSLEEKRALLAMLRGVSLADGVLAAAEHDALQALATRLEVPLTSIGELSLTAAVERLARSPRVLAFACLIVADTFFVDGDFDPAEKEFVASFATKHGLATNPLHEAVEKLRRQKLDDAISEWSDGIGES